MLKNAVYTGKETAGCGDMPLRETNISPIGK